MWLSSISGQKYSRKVVLKSYVCRDRVTNAGLVPGQQRDPRRGLDIEIAPALTCGEGRGNSPRTVGESCIARWRRNAKESGDDIVALLLVGAQQALLDDQKLSIEPAVNGAGGELSMDFSYRLVD